MKLNGLLILSPPFEIPVPATPPPPGRKKLLRLNTLWPPFDIPVPTTKNLIAAIVARAEADATFAELVPGGITLGEAQRDATVPYGSISVVSSVDDYSTGVHFLRPMSFQVNFVAYSNDDLDTIATCMNDLFNHKMAPLLFRDGRHGQVVSGGMHYNGESRSRSGKTLFHGYMEIISIHNRTLSPR